jgi:cytochrome P450
MALNQGDAAVYRGPIFAGPELEDSRALFKTLRDLGDAVWIPDLNLYIFARYADVVAALRTPDILISGEGVSVNAEQNAAAGMFTSTILSDGERHRHYKGIVTTPTAMAALKERIEALDESLRWDSTAQTFFRTTACDVEVDGETIPESSKIILFLGAANRDPRKWDQPDIFELERATSGHVGLGFGIHQCLGQMVARIESEVLLEALLPRIRSIRLTSAPVRRLNNTLHVLASLPVEIEPA